MKEQPPAKMEKDISGCYQSVYGKDTSLLQLKFVQQDSVQGALSYHYFEKDKSEGEFSGSVRDSIIVGWYRFVSEGQSSVRQVVFKISGDTLVEGFGNIEIIHDTAFFKKIDHLNYLSQRPLARVDCP